MSRTTNTLVLGLTGTVLAGLATACGTENSDAEPITRSDKVAEAAENYAGDPWEQRFLKTYFSDQAVSDAWLRHPELIGR